jgi:hypothetical protein
MPKLTPLLQATRTAQMLDVLALVTVNKENVTKACEAVGLSVAQYYHWLARSEEAVDAFREAIKEFGRVELASMLTASNYITEMMIDDALSPATDAMYRLAIKRYFDSRIDMLTDVHKARGTDAAREFLTGINLRSAESKFTSTTVETKSDGTVTVTVKPGSDIIDVTSRDLDDPEVPESFSQDQPVPSEAKSLIELGHQGGLDDLVRQLQSNYENG